MDSFILARVATVHEAEINFFNILNSHFFLLFYFYNLQQIYPSIERIIFLKSYVLM